MEGENITIDDVINPITQQCNLSDEAETFYRAMLKDFSNERISTFYNCTDIFYRFAIEAANMPADEGFTFHDAFLNQYLVEILQPLHTKNAILAEDMVRLVKRTLILIQQSYEQDSGKQETNYLHMGIDLLRNISAYVVGLSPEQKPTDFMDTLYDCMYKIGDVPARKMLEILTQQLDNPPLQPTRILDIVKAKYKAVEQQN